ncbi:MAG TPA: response regulator, partial [bacterium]
MKPVILVVDDEESVRESFRLALQDEYALTFAEDAKSTLKLIKSQSFDLCLLDIMLPDGSGIDLLRQIKRRDEFIDVIMVTALTSIDTALDAMKLGAYD